MKSKIKSLNPTSIITSSIILSTSSRVFAATAENCTKSSSSFLGFPTWYKYLNPTFQDGSCNIELNSINDLTKIALAIVEILLRLGGLLAVAFVIYGGFKYITSQGEPENTRNARATIVNSVIGLAITTIATALVTFIGSKFIK